MVAITMIVFSGCSDAEDIASEYLMARSDGDIETANELMSESLKNEFEQDTRKCINTFDSSLNFKVKSIIVSLMFDAEIEIKKSSKNMSRNEINQEVFSFVKENIKGKEHEEVLLKSYEAIVNGGKKLNSNTVIEIINNVYDDTEKKEYCYEENYRIFEIDEINILNINENKDGDIKTVKVEIIYEDDDTQKVYLDVELIKGDWKISSIKFL